MSEIEISLDDHFSKQLTQDMVEHSDKIVVFDVTDEPIYLIESKKIERWNIEDLGYELEDSVSLDRKVRDDIKSRVDAFIRQENIV